MAMEERADTLSLNVINRSKILHSSSLEASITRRASLDYPETPLLIAHLARKIDAFPRGHPYGLLRHKERGAALKYPRANP